MKVIILIYRHRHGEDISVYATEEAAICAGATLAMDWRHEIQDPELRRRIQELFVREQYGECVDLYNLSRESDESIEIHGPMDVL